MTYKGVDVALDANAHLTERPLWDDREQVLWWVDVFAGQVHRFGRFSVSYLASCG